MILMIDNYDSFTYNLVQYLRQIGESVEVQRNDAVSLAQIIGMAPQAIVISPGPGRPDTAGISLEIIKRLSGQVPILGVCLGHQSIAQAFGGRNPDAYERLLVEVMSKNETVVVYVGREEGLCCYCRMITGGNLIAEECM